MSEHPFLRDPALPFVESRRAARSRACYRAHSHPTLSIGAVDGGESLFRHAGGEVKLGAGDVVVIAPGVVHACNPRPGGDWSYQMLYLDAAWAGAALARMRPGAATGWPAATVLRERRAYAALCAVHALLDSDRSAAEKERALSGLLALLRRRVTRGAGVAPQAGTRLAALRATLAARCDEPWPLGEMARLAGLGREQLIRAFRADTGMTPHAWLLDQRINQAKPLLRAGQPLAEIAYRLRFADQSHFQRAFKARVAATPKQYGRAA